MVQIKDPERLKQLQAMFYSSNNDTKEEKKSKIFNPYFTSNSILSLVEEELKNIFKNRVKANRFTDLPDLNKHSPEISVLNDRVFSVCLLNHDMPYSSI